MCHFANIYRHTSFYITSLYCVFYKLKVCGNPASNKSVGAVFPITLALCLSVTFW